MEDVANPFSWYTQYQQYHEFAEAMKADLEAPEHREKLEQLSPMHEAAGVLRIYRNGMASQDMREVLGLEPTQLVQEIRMALDDEGLAKEYGQRIIDSGIKPGTK